MKILIYIVFTLIFFIQSCDNADSCQTQLKRHQEMEFNMTIDKIYIKDHMQHIKGYDSNGFESEFDYNGFFPLNDLVEKGDKFSKDSASLFYILRKKNVVYTFEWECQNGGILINSDTIE